MISYRSPPISRPEDRKQTNQRCSSGKTARISPSITTQNCETEPIGKANNRVRESDFIGSGKKMEQERTRIRIRTGPHYS